MNDRIKDLRTFVYYLITQKFIGNDGEILRTVFLDEFKKARSQNLFQSIDISKITNYLTGARIIESSNPKVYMIKKSVINELKQYDYSGSIIYREMLRGSSTSSKSSLQSSEMNFKRKNSLASSSKNSSVSPKTMNSKASLSSFSNFSTNSLSSTTRKSELYDFVFYLLFKRLIDNNGQIRKSDLLIEFNKLKNMNLLKSIEANKIVNYLFGEPICIYTNDANSFQFKASALERIKKHGKLFDQSEIYRRIILAEPSPKNNRKMENRIFSNSKMTSSCSDLLQSLKNLRLTEHEVKDCETTIRHRVTYIREIDHKFYITSKCCIICRINFIFENEFSEHLDSHQNGLVPQMSFNQITKPYFDMTFNLNITSTNIDFQIRCLQGTHFINKIVLYHPHNLVITLSSELWPHEILAGETLTFYGDRDLFLKINYSYAIVIHFINSQELVEKHEMIVNKLFPPIIKFDFNLEIEKKAIKRRQKSLSLYSLRQYRPTKDLRFLFSNKFEFVENMTDKQTDLNKEILKYSNEARSERLTQQNYTEILKNLVSIEDLQTELDMYGYDKIDQVYTMRSGFYIIQIENLLEHRPSLMDGDSLYTLPMRTPDLEINQTRRLNGFIQRVEQEYIVIKFATMRNIGINLNEKYRIHFLPNRLNCQMEQQALDIIKNSFISSFLFPKTITHKIVADIQLDWFNNDIQDNPEQQQAIKNIFYGTSYPAPYLLFGPPGTGKTMTLVESIAQLWRNQPSSRILVAAPSNTACDEVAIRLINYIVSEDLYRIFAVSKERDIDKIDANLLEISNLDSGMHLYPPLELIYKYRIVLTTLTVAGRLVQARIDPNHFSHVFIDECGSATEPAALIAIAGMITSKNNLNGQIILAGDPKQLGPILQSKMADSLGLSRSLLERLMDLPLYQKDPETHKYNPRVLTKLVRNFRSHASILKLPSKLFYEDELIAVGRKEKTDWALKWKYLQNPNFPILFRSVSGRPMQDKNSPSWYNSFEVEYVCRYTVDLLKNGINNRRITQEDIGIISPYKKQCSKIRMQLDHLNFKDIEVSSVEAFQGKEKPIIILSTVRSNMRSIGFLDNPKRMNVALTRAQALLIIIGDPKVLQKDPHWKQLIDYCLKHKAFVGHPFALK